MHVDVRIGVRWQHGGLESGSARQALPYTQKLLQTKGIRSEWEGGGPAEACQEEPAVEWLLSDEGIW